MVILILRIIEKLLIIYFSLYFIIDIGLFLYSLYVFSRKTRKQAPADKADYAGRRVSVIVPAYNEEVSIVHCTELLLEQDYPDYEVILVNDGSRDKTLEVLLKHFDFQEFSARQENPFVTRPVKKTYQVPGSKLILIDKENGGKADSINAGINISTGSFICTIDADSILDPNALKEVVRPFILNPDTIVSGGQLAASNDMVLVHNRVVSAKTPQYLGYMADN